MNADVTTDVVRGKGSIAGRTVVRRSKRSSDFEHLEPIAGQMPGEPARSIDGWVIIVTGLPQETKIGDILDAFPQPITNVRMTLDPVTCLCVGHALLQYPEIELCREAEKTMSGKHFMGSSLPLRVDPAFLVEEPEAIGDADEEERKRKRD